MSEDSNKRIFVEVGGDSEENFDEDPLLNKDCCSTINYTVLDLHKQSNERHGINSRIDKLERQLADLTNDFCKLRADYTQLKPSQLL